MAIYCPDCFWAAGAVVRRAGVAGQGPPAWGRIPCPEDTASYRCHLCPGFRRSVFPSGPGLVPQIHYCFIQAFAEISLV